jgi:hypothetical protein
MFWILWPTFTVIAACALWFVLGLAAAAGNTEKYSLWIWFGIPILGGFLPAIIIQGIVSLF